LRPGYASLGTDMDIVGIDIGGTHFRIGTVGTKNTVTDFRKIPVNQIFSSSDPMDDLSRYLSAYCEGKDIAAVSIGFPATLDAKRRTVLQAPNVPFMENLPVVEVLSQRMGIPVHIERDVIMAMEYDCHQFQVPPMGVICGFYFGTGIGNGIFIHGMPLVGKDGTAGELGHIPVDGNMLPCGCGNTGCMETVAGGKYLAELSRGVFKGTHISELFVKHGNDPLLKQFVNRMAISVATEVNLLNPDVILIGGGVPSMTNFPKEFLLERIHYYARKPLPADSLNILFTQDHEHKSVIGAAQYCRKKLQ